MLKVLSNEEMRSLDNKTIKEIGIPGIVLMERASRGCADAFMERLDNLHYPLVYVFAGKGNNGGDGLAIARYLIEAGYNIQIFSTIQPDEYKGDAAINASVAKNMDIPWYIIDNEDQLLQLPQPAGIIDALYGTGFSGKLENLDQKIVACINRSSAFVLSVDIPTGINGNLPVVVGDCVQANLTVTMAAIKIAHLFYPARFFVGELEVIDIGIPGKEMNRKEFSIQLIEESDIQLPARSANAHKYKFGRILIIAGSYGMTGAAVMAARAASLVGGGMVHLAVPETIYPIAESQLVGEIVVPIVDKETGIFNFTSEQQLLEEISWADCILIGPGIGKDDETIQVVRNLLDKIDTPAVIDADALNAVSIDNSSKYKNKQWLITPHHGEFSRISWHKGKQIEDNPLALSLEFAKKSGLTVNLKNAPSLVATPSGQIFINSTGNSSLAKAGTGDVLAGMIIGLMGQGVDSDKASYLANYIHGFLADWYVDNFDPHSLTPEKLLAYLPQHLKRF